MPPALNSGPPAPLWRRVAAILYDGLLLFGVWIVASAVLVLATGGRMADPDRPMLMIWILRLVLLGLTAGFFVWFWTHGGQTLGMRAWRLRLVARDGRPVTVLQAGVRLLASVFALLPAGLGLVWMVFDRDRLAWNDRWSGTRLIVTAKRS